MSSLPRTPAGPSTPSIPHPTSTASLLPPPQSFDILPPLHALLSRLLPSSQSLTNPQSQTNPYRSTGTDNGVPEDGSGATAGGPSLEIQNLAAEAAVIKIRIQKARAAVGRLPDLERTVEEQMGEIRELEGRVAEQRAVLRRLREKGLEELEELG